MTSREIKIAKAVRLEFESKTQQTLARLIKDFETNKNSILASFQRAIAIGLKNVAEARPQKGKINFICISFLLTSVLSDKCEYRIDFYNNNFYLDEIESECYWEAEFLTPIMQDDYTFFERLLKRNLVRVMDYEIHKTVVSFSIFYHSVMAFFFQELIASIDIKQYEGLLESEVIVIYGGFLDKGVQLTVLRD